MYRLLILSLLYSIFFMLFEAGQSIQDETISVDTTSNSTNFTDTDSSAIHVKCKEDWELFQNSCYYFSPEDDYDNWFRSESNCLEMYGHLSIISSVEENAFIKQKSIENKRNYWIDGLYVPETDFWIWGSSGQEICEFSDWIDGPETSSPNTTEPLCAYMSRKNTKWTAGGCHKYGYYACERELNMDVIKWLDKARVKLAHRFDTN